MALTEKDEPVLKDIVKFVADFFELKDQWPTLADIASHCGVRRDKAREFLGTLQDRGQILFITPRSRLAGFAVLPEYKEDFRYV